MKKTLLCAAILGALPGIANAQSSVTLYGVVDLNLEYANHVGVVPTAANKFNSGPGGTVVRMDSGGLSGSRWGLRGVEDLGGGRKALFVLENGFSADTGTFLQSGRAFGRQAYVGLSTGPHLEVTFGRQYTSLFDAMANFVPAAYASQYEPIVPMAGTDFREDNMVKYVGTFGPIKATMHGSFGTGLALPQTNASGFAYGGNGEVPGQARRDSAYGAALVYSANTLAATVAYDQFNPSIGTSTGTFKRVAVAASYAFGNGKIMGGYRWAQNKDQAGNVALRDDFYWIGAAYQATPALAFMVEYDYDKIKALFGSSQVANPWQIALISTYSFSKRTDVYMTTAYSRNAGLGLDSAANSYPNSLAFGNSYALGANDHSMFGIALGMRHKF